MAARTLMLACALFVCSSGRALAQLTVTFNAAPQPVQFAGYPTVLDASATHAGTEVPVYRFEYRPAGGNWTLAREFFQGGRFDWTTLDEGIYELRVTARLVSTGETAQATRSHFVLSPGHFAPRVLPTAHPLVALYSAPPCSGGFMRVVFRHQQSSAASFTPFKPCASGKALNFHIAGMRASSTYFVQHQHYAGATKTDGPVLAFQTGAVAAPVHAVTVTQPPAAGASLADATLLFSFLGGMTGWFPVATDLTGATTWYYSQQFSSVLRPLPGGNMLLVAREDVGGRILREIDLGGNTVRETNSAEVARQLAAMGIDDTIGVFHHEAIRLANGHTLALMSVERILTDEQGPGEVNVYGEMVVDLDENFQVAWVWNAFDHLDRTRMAILGEVCTFEGPGCPALFLRETANDWLHANAIGYVPDDGNVIVSLRHQDWVIKIDYADGLGTGAVIWKLGAGGDFSLQGSSAPSAWFSHQHDARMAGGALSVYDNGNTRIEPPDGTPGNSRGQAWLLDEVNHTARLVLNYDLGGYASALGSAERISNGNFSFNNGFLGSQEAPLSETIELAPDGTRLFAVSSNAFVYRSFRMTDLYRP